MFNVVRVGKNMVVCNFVGNGVDVLCLYVSYVNSNVKFNGRLIISVSRISSIML